MPQELALTTEYMVMASIAPVTPGGDPASVDGEPVWDVTSGEGSIAELTPPDPMKRWLSAEASGDVVFTVTADADMGAGVVTLADTFLLHFSNPMAAQLGASLGAPELKP